MWPKMRVCATFAGTLPGTKCPSSWEPGHLSTSAMTGQRQFWGPDRTGKSFSGVWDFRFCLFDGVLCCSGGGGGSFNPNQATSTILVRIIQQSCKCSKLISMCAGATILFCPSTATGTPEKKTSESTGQGWGAKKVLFSHRSSKFPDFFDLTWKFIT